LSASSWDLQIAFYRLSRTVGAAPAEKADAGRTKPGWEPKSRR
jgi:hypothetical protein